MTHMPPRPSGRNARVPVIDWSMLSIAPKPPAITPSPPLSNLTPIEREVRELISLGYSEEVAASLAATPNGIAILARRESGFLGGRR